MTDNDKRWLFLLAGNVEVSHLYDGNGDIIGMALSTETEYVECRSPMEVNAVVDRWINLTQYTGSIH